ncbi:phage virion morphogenesis protein [Sphingobacterium cavernae]|uniref:phage virion morphogenesis protein n=1 Tax=Sphingobacterium cavernae TaxID=2592657 RepID=UPI00122FC11A|nr:phage virion morphogenesis protein [Sphingobacterium cavernae]
MKKFDQQLQAIFNKIESKIDLAPQLVAETALEHFQNALIKKQWDGKPYQQYKNKKHEPSRGSLMMRTNNLFRTLKIVSVSNTIASLSAGSSKVPYAKIHNEGGTIQHQARTTIVTHKKFTRGKFKGKTLFAKNNEKASFSQRASIGAYTTTMPQRQFMGKSPALMKEIKNRFKTHFKNL